MGCVSLSAARAWWRGMEGLLTGGCGATRRSRPSRTAAPRDLGESHRGSRESHRLLRSLATPPRRRRSSPATGAATGPSCGGGVLSVHESKGQFGDPESRSGSGDDTIRPACLKCGVVRCDRSQKQRGRGSKRSRPSGTLAERQPPEQRGTEKLTMKRGNVCLGISQS